MFAQQQFEGGIIILKCIRTLGGHRRIHISEIERIIAGKKRRYKNKKLGVATYARVSSHDQKKKGDLIALITVFQVKYMEYSD